MLCYVISQAISPNHQTIAFWCIWGCPTCRYVRKIHQNRSCTRPTAPCRSAILSTKTERRNFGDRTKPIGGKPKRKQHLALNISGIVKPPKFDAYLNLFDLICIWFGISFSRFRMAIFYFGVPHCQTPELPFSATSPMTWISEVVPPRPPEKLWGNVEPGVGAELGTTLDVCIKPGTTSEKIGSSPPKKRECNATRSPKIRVLFLRLFLILYVLLMYMFHPIKCTIDSMFHMLLDITDVNNTMIPRDSQRWDPRFPKIPRRSPDPQRSPRDPPDIQGT